VAVPFLSGAIEGFYGQRRLPALEFARTALLINTWTYFSLNFAFARYPWPWQPWTPRTPNAIIFFVCAIGLTAGGLADRSPRLVQLGEHL
jgi:hypothetical protein